ncbi:MAG: hypothetical protein J7502_19835, partial [Flavisolibacter sp.]|nr:hypothetical protein [Flavisolibacter sp.]
MPDNKIPSDFDGTLLTGGTFEFFSDDTCAILVQEVDEIDFRFRLISGKAHAPVTAIDRLKERGIYCTFVFQNKIVKDVDIPGKFEMGANCCLAVYGADEK